MVIDLKTEGWPVIQTPYLVPLHSSAITCSHHVSAIPLKLWERIITAGDLQKTHYSKKVHQNFLKVIMEVNKALPHARLVNILMFMLDKIIFEIGPDALELATILFCTSSIKVLGFELKS